MDGYINASLAHQCSAALGAERLTFAIDSRNGKISSRGWKENTAVDPFMMIDALQSYCSAFLYTHIDTEGTMSGFPLEVARKLRQATTKQLIVAGGIRSLDEVQVLDQMGVDAVVGMAIYTGKIST